MSFLTVGMLTHDDYNGVYFSIQSILLYHPELKGKVNFVVLDNSPDTDQGKETEAYCKKVPGCYYSAIRGAKSTSLRNLVFEMAPTDHVVCMDSHVFMVPKSLHRLIKFYENNPSCHDLIQGPICGETGDVIATEMLPGFRGSNFGVWHTREEGKNIQGEPFEIAGQGMGMFACTRPGWLRFTAGMREFGGEELSIHERFRLSGRKAWCLPFLQWVHRFGRPGGPTYPINTHSKCKNIMRTFRDIGLPLDPVVEYYAKRLSNNYDLGLDVANQLKAEIEKGPACAFNIPEGYKHFLGHEIQLLD